MISEEALRHIRETSEETDFYHGLLVEALARYHALLLHNLRLNGLGSVCNALEDVYGEDIKKVVDESYKAVQQD